jgi:hypothetical protein
VPSQFDLVPEIPLNEYVQNFRYVPPNDPEEITMRGETPVLDREPPATSDAASVPAEEMPIASPGVVPPPTSEDVRERLGLEVNGTAEERSDRPRFLDFNEPSAPLAVAPSAQPISGPSFLGLSDMPSGEVEAANELVVEDPANGKWRTWLAAAVVLIFGSLGVLEWRAQVRQTNNGPLEIVKLKMRNLTHGKLAESTHADSTSPVTASDFASKPEMQVEAPPKPQNPNRSASTTTSDEGKDAAVPNTNTATTPAASSGRVTPAPSANRPAAERSTGTPPQNLSPNSVGTSAGQNVAAAKSTSLGTPKLNGTQPPGLAGAATADRPKQSQRAADDSEEVVVKKIIPGADEMAKANNASDSAAEAAWLWKATAKGNAAAPVRLADMYVKGDGVPRSCEQAVVLLKTAAEKENALARNRLASMYGSGTCVQRNRVEAYRWVSSALVADPNSEWAQQNRNLLWQQMTSEERTQAERYK